MGRTLVSCTGWVKIMAAPAQADKKNQVDQTSEEPSTVFICIYNLYRRFLEVCTVLQGLVSVFLVISGTLQLLWMSDLAEDDQEVRHLSTCKQICWMIIISGIFVFLWTLFGWVVYIRGSNSLSITCGVSSFIIVIMFYFMYCGSSDHYHELHPQFTLSFIIIFFVIIHALFIIARLRNTTEDALISSKIFLEKDNHAKHKLAFSSDVYHC